MNELQLLSRSNSNGYIVEKYLRYSIQLIAATGFCESFFLFYVNSLLNKPSADFSIYDTSS